MARSHSFLCLSSIAYILAIENNAAMSIGEHILQISVPVFFRKILRSRMAVFYSPINFLRTSILFSTVTPIYTLTNSLCVCVHAKSLQSCPNLFDPMNCSWPGSSVHGILQERILEWVAMPSSRGSSRPSV